MSEVYQATDIIKNRPAAVKLLSPEFASDLRATQMARREAWVIARMRHPTIPTLYDHGEVLLREGVVVPCTVMELLNGRMLADRLSEGPLPWHQAATVAATVADVLAVAHRRGIVHRDLTSGNVMLATNGVKIIDFGLADVLETSAPPTGRLFFRAHDRAATPESDGSLGKGEPADDVFSLGVLLYQMLTGHSPYLGSDDHNHDHSAAARQRRAAPTPVLVIPGMPRPIANICRDCMSKKAADRPDSVTVALALWSVLV